VFEVILYCDTCENGEWLKHLAAADKSSRVAVSQMIHAAQNIGFKKTRKGWQCPDCLKK
jgi:hypothetical protein